MPLRSLCAALFLALVAAPSAANDLLPRPPELEPSVRFWIRVYSEVDGDAGLIHDSRHLDVVYEVIRLPKGLSRRAREGRVEKAKDRIRAILRRLAQGKRTGLTGEEAAVLALWPNGVTNQTLREAAGRLRFQLGQADKFLAGLEREGAWRDYIERTLVAHDVPVELASLPHVESSYNPKAYSRVGAAGLWQFTRSTGRRYLRIDTVVDERLDPFAATVGAARLLRENHRLTQSWPLAITAYNHGAAGMRRAAQKLGTRDIAKIVAKYNSRTFGFASRNFYTSFLAARHVDENAARYFGTIHAAQPVEYRHIELPYFTPVTALAKAFSVDIDTLREHNNSLRPSVWNGSKHVPKGFELRIPSASIPADPSILLANVPESMRLSQQHRDRYYKVRRGDTLSRISRRFDVRERELVALNNLRSRNRIRAGQVLVLPDDAAGPPVIVARAEVPADGVYRVRRGDSLSIIARRFGVSESALVRENGIRNRHRIAVGQRLRIPGAATAVAAAKPAPPAAKPVVVASAEATRRSDAAALPAAEPAPAERAPAPEPTPLAEPAGAPAPEPMPAPVAETDGSSRSAVGATPPDPSDYAVRGDRIHVQADETLGHYAEWLELRASRLRSINGLRFDQELPIGRRLRLDFGRVTPEEFERRRLEYHRSLQEEFFAAYEVTGTESHRLRKGESLWYLAARKYRLPVWLLRQYNPDLDFASLPAGALMVVPQVEPRG